MLLVIAAIYYPLEELGFVSREETGSERTEKGKRILSVFGVSLVGIALLFQIWAIPQSVATLW